MLTSYRPSCVKFQVRRVEAHAQACGPEPSAVNTPYIYLAPPSLRRVSTLLAPASRLCVLERNHHRHGTAGMHRLGWGNFDSGSPQRHKRRGNPIGLPDWSGSSRAGGKVRPIKVWSPTAKSDALPEPVRRERGHIKTNCRAGRFTQRTSALVQPSLKKDQQYSRLSIRSWSHVEKYRRRNR